MPGSKKSWERCHQIGSVLPLESWVLPPLARQDRTRLFPIRLSSKVLLHSSCRPSQASEFRKMIKLSEHISEWTIGRMEVHLTNNTKWTRCQKITNRKEQRLILVNSPLMCSRNAMLSSNLISTRSQCWREGQVLRSYYLRIQTTVMLYLALSMVEANPLPKSSAPDFSTMKVSSATTICLSYQVSLASSPDVTRGIKVLASRKQCRRCSRMAHQILTSDSWH